MKHQDKGPMVPTIKKICDETSDLYVINAAFGMVEALDLRWDDQHIQDIAIRTARKFVSAIKKNSNDD